MPPPNGVGCTFSEILGHPACTHMRNNNQILHGDQSRCVAYFY